jgi:alkylated DNA repair dioxygenase AlkB
MNLFSTETKVNLLPCEGVAEYHGLVMSGHQADTYYQLLMEGIDWKNDEAMIFGRHMITKRKVAWYGDEDYSYTYSKMTKQALPWTKELLELKKRVEEITGAEYNSCLLNLYHNGTEGMAWHSDDEKALANLAPIASLSFGAARKFCFKHKKTKQTICHVLESGSLLVMKGSTQKNWLHRLPTTKKIASPRINLTFRIMAP